MVTPWAKGWRPPAIPSWLPNAVGTWLLLLLRVVKPSGLPRDPTAPSPHTPRAWQPPQGSLDGLGAPLTLVCHGAPQPWAWRFSCPRTVLQPFTDPRVCSSPSSQAWRFSCLRTVLQPLTDGPGGLPDLGCTYSPRAPGLGTLLTRGLLIHGPGSSPAPECSCSPSPTALEALPPRGDPAAPHREPTLRRRGSNLRFDRLGGGLASRHHSDAAAPAGPRNLAGPRPSPACWGRAREAAAAAMMGVGSPHQPPVGPGTPEPSRVSGRCSPATLSPSAAWCARLCIPEPTAGLRPDWHRPWCPPRHSLTPRWGPEAVGGGCPQAGLGWGPYGEGMGQ